MPASIHSLYHRKFEEYSYQLQKVLLQLKRFAWFRFFSFAAIFIPLFIFGLKSWFTLILSLSAIILFFWLVKKNIQFDNLSRRFTVLKKITEDELLALKHQFSQFKNGKEYLNPEHFFSYDLDLFGEGSLFQYINRTSTISGQQKLADWFIKPPLKIELIKKKQEAVRELSTLFEWRLDFLANGKMFEETMEMHKEIISWSALELKLKKAKSIKWILLIIPVLTIISFIPAFVGITNLFAFLMVFVQWIFLYSYWKTITEYFKFFGRKSALLSKYMQLLHMIEEKDFNSELLCELQEKVSLPEKSSKIFSQLKKLVQQFEYRQNFLVGFALNSIFLWDIRCVFKLWLWHNKNHNKLKDWLEVVSEMDTLISFSNLASNNPEFSYPEIRGEKFTFSAFDLGHPLLQSDKRICNDFEIEGWSKAMIITGANMAGKSTFLRTVGVNLILARTGAPVCAKKMVFTPVEIYTNMRTTDSLIKDESYFFAELKRIKGVLELLQKGERIFVILDEMLKGTNSIDKLNGSRELVRKLVEFEAVSLIATHDLKLSEMEKEYPEKVFNKCFEIRIENDELVFDYKLSNGITKTMNATFLMKKMGII